MYLTLVTPAATSLHHYFLLEPLRPIS
jgi:hypothetical protein